MITKTKNLVVVTTKWVAKSLSCFEAMERIRNISEINGVLKNNKTPFILGDIDTYSDYDLGDVHVIEFSEDSLRNSMYFTNWARERGFESGEYIEPGVMYDTHNESCILCKIINHYGYPVSTDKYNLSDEVPEWDLIIYESPNFIVVTEYGQLKAGLLMIVPKKHSYLSMAMLPESLYDEYAEVRKDVSTILKSSFGSSLPVIFWEHGSSPTGLSSHKKSIVHAHTHVLVDFKIEEKYLNMVQMHDNVNIEEMRKTHYFSYREEWDGKILACYDDNVYVQRQYPRQILADSLGYAPDQYNWRNYGFDENIHITAYKLYKYLSSSKVPQRIKERTKSFVLPYRIRFISRLYSEE